MKKLLSCAFNMDTGCVELRFSDGSLCSIDFTAVENEVARNMYERSELDYLIYNDPVGYADRRNPPAYRAKAVHEAPGRPSPASGTFSRNG